MLDHGVRRGKGHVLDTCTKSEDGPGRTGRLVEIPKLSRDLETGTPKFDHETADIFTNVVKESTLLSLACIHVASTSG